MEYFKDFEYNSLVFYPDLVNDILKFHDPVKAQQQKRQKIINWSFWQINHSKVYEHELYLARHPEHEDILNEIDYPFFRHEHLYLLNKPSIMLKLFKKYKIRKNNHIRRFYTEIRDMNQIRVFLNF